MELTDYEGHKQSMVQYLTSRIEQICLTFGEKKEFPMPVYYPIPVWFKQIWRYDTVLFQLAFVSPRKNKMYKEKDGYNHTQDTIHRIDYRFNPVFFAKNEQLLFLDSRNDWEIDFSMDYRLGL